MKRIDLSDKIFGQLKVMKLGPTIQTASSGDRTTWICKCNCGNEIQVKAVYLKQKRRPTTRCRECRYKGIK